MAVETRVIQHVPKIKRDQDSKPTLINWKNQKIIRNHSMIKTVEEVLHMNENLDVVQINLIGKPHSGKTEQMRVIAHIAHKIAKIPYSFKLFDKNALLNFESTLKALTPTNWVLGFDDLSFLGAKANKKQMEIDRKSVV